MNQIRNHPVWLLKMLAEDGNQEAFERLCELAEIGAECFAPKPTRSDDDTLIAKIVELCTLLTYCDVPKHKLTTKVINYFQLLPGDQPSESTIKRYIKKYYSIPEDHNVIRKTHRSPPGNQHYKSNIMQYINTKYSTSEEREVMVKFIESIPGVQLSENTKKKKTKNNH